MIAMQLASISPHVEEICSLVTIYVATDSWGVGCRSSNGLQGAGEPARTEWKRLEWTEWSWHAIYLQLSLQEALELRCPLNIVPNWRKGVQALILHLSVSHWPWLPPWREHNIGWGSSPQLRAISREAHLCSLWS